jgi:predicted PurR-regulated permease PerM
MAVDDDRSTSPAMLTTEAIDVAIRFGLLALLGYWSWGVIAPFITIVLWSAILAVALYPLFDWLSEWLGRRGLAAALITLLCLLIVVAPVAWLGIGMISGVKFMANELGAGLPSIPLPKESVKDWPIVGEQVFQFWTRAVTDIKAQLVELAPVLKPMGSKLLEIATNSLFGLLKFLVSIIVAGFLFNPGPHLVDGLVQFMERVFRPRGLEMVQLAGATIRNVSRGVIGIALLQSFLAGAGFLAAGVPGAGILAFLSLLLGIVQIGPAIVFLPVIIWSWTTMETVNALLFTAYMVPVGILDNLLKPMLMARGLTTPMPVIIVGVIGGTIAYGIIGLFSGPIVLAVAWELVNAWRQAGDGPSLPGPSTSAQR